MISIETKFIDYKCLHMKADVLRLWYRSVNFAANAHSDFFYFITLEPRVE